ncbi:DNA excision repair protein ERCC-6 [Bulinus truncatus]|nr:DNA excision repair protein ERCC-6 [Bulinus truncatus]
MNKHPSLVLPTHENYTNASDADELSNISKENETTGPNDPFHVDTGLIPQASLDDQEAELQGMGLSVFNQFDLEQGIMDQVDRALAKEEENRYRKILEKELKTINDDISLAKVDLKHVNDVEDRFESAYGHSRDTQRHLESVRKQKENKLKQLKTLKTRRENVNKKLNMLTKSVQSEEETGEDDSSTFDCAFTVGKQKESNKERLIRTGAMTPFGTVVKTSLPEQKTKDSGSGHMSIYEKTLMAKEPPSMAAMKSFDRYLKKKGVRMNSGEGKSDQTDGDTDGSKNNLSRKGFRRSCKLEQKTTDLTECTDDPKNDDYEFIVPSEEDDYLPSQEESSEDDYSGNSEDDVEVSGPCKRKKQSLCHSRGKKKPRPLPKYKENEDVDQRQTKIKRDLSIRQEKDDADPEFYNARLLKLQKKEEKESEYGDKVSTEDEEWDKEYQFDGSFQVPKKLWKKLFPYQKTGVRWLWELHCQQAGGIIGDEMGLGKTIQTIAFLAALKTSKVKNVNFPYKGLGPTIIVCPTTVMHQWLKEFHKWWPDFRVAILHSSGSFTGSESDLVRSMAKSQGILITSYNTLVIHQELVLRFNWHYVILDEGHKIRNPDAKVTLCCKQFRTPHRIILSGSPIQNNLKELWSLFDFVFPGKLGTLPDFMQHFSIPIVQGGYSNATQVQVETAFRCACVLRDTINPYLIRRMKADVKKGLDLPNKNEQVLFCRLTDEQRDVYQEYLDSRQCQDILQGKFQVFVGLITLRKICNHPDLSTCGPQMFKGQLAPTDPEYQFGYYKRSGKMIVVEALLRLWYKQQHRVLLFTQSKAMLNVLEKFVQEQGYTYLCMDGGTSISSRQPLISQYNNDPSIYLFLLTTRVGGLGVNLTGADRVIIYDPDWNPSTDIQARERAWRIGQTRQVTIYRLLTSGTIEEKIYHRQIFKQYLTNRILKDPKQRRLFKSQDLMELFTLGSKDNKVGTETSALFAGTGSNVKIPKRRRRNRFDEMEEKQKSKKIEDEKSGSHVEPEELDMELDIEKLDQMKELARRLSRQMEEEKKRRQVETRDSDKNADYLPPYETVQSENSKAHLSVEHEKSKAHLYDEHENSKSDLSVEHENSKSDLSVEHENSKAQLSDEHENSKSYLPIEHENSKAHLYDKHENSKSDLSVEHENSKAHLSVEHENDTLHLETIPSINDFSEQKSLLPSFGKDNCELENLDRNHSQSSIPQSVDAQISLPVTDGTNETKAADPPDKKNNWQRNGKLWTIPRKSLDTKEHQSSEEKDKNRLKSPTRFDFISHRSESVNSDDYFTDEELTSKKSKGKKKKRKHHHDARFEGERIPHLVKHCPLAQKREVDDQPAISREQKKENEKHEDDYVLRQLFKKTGIEGAMKHDKIMDSGRPDYAIVEAEAEKVAREAAAALRRSRQLCSSALSGLPSWTGHNGGLARPRFGQKKNSLLVTKPKTEPSDTSVQQSQSQKNAKDIKGRDRLFDGSTSGIVSLTSRNETLTSNDLLSRIKSRKRISTVAVVEDDDFLRPDQPQTVEKKDEDLLEDIRNYVAFMGNTNGEATTEEIILNFGKRLPKSDAPKFKAMLNQICDFHGGIWKLRSEFS